MTQDPDNRSDGSRRLTVRQMLGSALAAAVGVQSSENRARDFSRGNPVHFVIAGIILTIAFVVGVVLLVQMVLATAA